MNQNYMIKIKSVLKLLCPDDLAHWGAAAGSLEWNPMSVTNKFSLIWTERSAFSPICTVFS